MKRERIQRKGNEGLDCWGRQESIDLYGIERWSEGVFSANSEGHVCLRDETHRNQIDLKELVDELRLRGLTPPVLIRFTDILRRRLEQIADAFDQTIKEYDYHGDYRGVYPIKVNQHRHVLEDIVKVGRARHWGLECGSKPELMLSIALHDDPEGLIICNGFKDHDYIESALYARRLGNRIFLVIEKPWELPLALDISRKMGIEPLLGVRIKLASRGKGKWESSGGERSKFGLRADEVVEVVRTLKRRKMLHTFQLMHWHLGSQISDIQCFKDALKEGLRFYVELHRMGVPLQYLDVGGGLAVDYDGSHTNFSSSANYSIHEYAGGVVSAVADACNEAEIPHPTIITEAGRALVTHHAVLVLEAIASSAVASDSTLPVMPRGAPEVLRRIRDIADSFAGKNFQEIFHDALEARQDALALFKVGQLSLGHRAIAESYFWSVCRQIHQYVRGLDYVPDEMAGLERLLCSTYYCNFSLFQSLPDHWAIKQLFPVVPLHRLKERPTCNAILADLTCDSDGVMDRFVDLRDVKDTLPLHPLHHGKPYYLGVFLVGAYQEILGDLHNLFGDTHAVHVSAGEDGYVIDKAVEGDSTADILDYVQFSRRDIMARMRARIESALSRKAMKLEESAPFMSKFEESLDDYTYFMARDEYGARR